ncbi:MAG: FKBP-type peptidyl-prolyl cis-trans isomerase [Bacteroidales bacterium]|nr:FKBP-type peptidyl-prolyl cis-trans isomerase [Bacteroidales bacterium]
MINRRNILSILYLGVLISALALTLSACKKSINEDYAAGKNPAQAEFENNQARIKNTMTNANKIISEKEKERIKNYIQRRKWNLKETGGIFLEQTQEGVGALISEKNSVTLKYTSFYLNGNSASEFNESKSKNQSDNNNFNNKDLKKENNIKNFNVNGDTDVVFGLLIAVKHLKNKSKARVIVPDNLAFYTDENGEKIQAHASLVYEIEILEVR